MLQRNNQKDQELQVNELHLTVSLYNLGKDRQKTD